MKQNLPIFAKELRFKLHLQDGSGQAIIIEVVMPINHHSDWSMDVPVPVKASYFAKDGAPLPFIVAPPLYASAKKPQPPLLALRMS